MNKAVEADGSTRLIALGLCLTVVVLIGFVIEAATRGPGATADSDATAPWRPTTGSHITHGDAESATEQLNSNQSPRADEIESA